MHHLYYSNLPLLLTVASLQVARVFPQNYHVLKGQKSRHQKDPCFVYSTHLDLQYHPNKSYGNEDPPKRRFSLLFLDTHGNMFYNEDFLKEE